MSRAAFHVVTSNRIEVLAGVLADLIAARGSAFEPITVITPNRGLERWLDRELAQRLDVLANVRFERLESHLARRAPRGTRWLSRAELEGRYLATLFDLEAVASSAPASNSDAALAPIVRYLGLQERRLTAASVDARSLALARILTSLAEDYARQRPDWIRAWLADEPPPADASETHLLERSLYRAARQRQLTRGRHDDARPRISLAELELSEGLREGASREAGGREERRREDLSREDAGRDARSGSSVGAAPERVVLLGFSSLPAAALEALTTLSERASLLLLMLSPSAEFWSDARRNDPAAGEEGPVDRWLAVLGRPLRELLAELDSRIGYGARGAYRSAPPTDQTRLARLRRAMLERAPIAATSEPAEDDGSLLVIASPSRRREIEALAVDLWARIGRPSSSPLGFHEVAVLVPRGQVAAYAPILETVFREAHEIPWSSDDVVAETSGLVVDAAKRLFDVLGRPPTRASWLDLLGHPLFQAHLGEVLPDAIADLIARVGFVRGVDAEDHRGTYLADPENRDALHFASSRRRIALAAVRGPIEGEGPSLDVSLEDEAALAFTALATSLAEDTRALEAPRSFSAWRDVFVRLVEAYLRPRDAREESERRQLVGRLQQLDAYDIDGRSVSYAVARDIATRLASERGSSRGEPFVHGVNVATLAASRPIPHRVIYVVGLGEGLVPERRERGGLDLLTEERRRLDTSEDELERLALLEATLVVRDRIVLSYVARDETTGDPIEPSSMLRELEAVLGPLPTSHPPLRRHEAPELRGADVPRGAGVFLRARDEERARSLGGRERGLLEAAIDRGAPFTMFLPHDARRSLLSLPSEPLEPVGARRTSTDAVASTDGRATSPPRDVVSVEPPPEASVSLRLLRAILDCPLQGVARASLGEDRAEEEVRDLLREDEPLEVDALGESTLARAVLEDVFAPTGARTLEESLDRRIAAAQLRGELPLGILAASERARLGEAASAIVSLIDACLGGTRPLTALRFGPSRDEADRAEGQPAIALEGPALDELDGQGPPRRVRLVGTTRGLFTTDAGAETTRTMFLIEPRAERLPRGRLRRRLAHAFLEHAMLAASDLEADRPREVFVIGTASATRVVFRAVTRERARAYLSTLALRTVPDDPRTRPTFRGLGFFPIEAAIDFDEASHGTSARRERPDLERIIEAVREREGGQSRYGPLLDATSRPALEPRELERDYAERFGLFFESLASTEERFSLDAEGRVVSRERVAKPRGRRVDHEEVS